MKLLFLDQKRIDFFPSVALRGLMTEADPLLEKLDQLERYAKERKEEAEKVLTVADTILNKIAELRPRAKANNSDQEIIELLEDYSYTLKRLLKDWNRLTGSDTL